MLQRASSRPGKQRVGGPIRSGNLAFVGGIGGWYPERRPEGPGDVRRAYEGLSLELRANKALEHGLGARFRKERAALDELLAAAHDGEHPLAPGLVAFADAS